MNLAIKNCCASTQLNCNFEPYSTTSKIPHGLPYSSSSSSKPNWPYLDFLEGGGDWLVSKARDAAAIASTANPSSVLSTLDFLDTKATERLLLVSDPPNTLLQNQLSPNYKTYTTT